MSALAVLGAGSWGTTLALHLERRGHAVRLWEFDPSRARELAASRLSLPFLPEHPLPPSIAVTADLAGALAGAEMALFAVPSTAVRSLGESVRAIPRAGAAGAWPRTWISATKGIEERTGLTPRAVFAESAGVPEIEIVVLAGPSFAAEVARGRPTAVLAAGTDGRRAAEVQAALSSDAFRVYTSEDPLGVEIGVAVKNVIAIAAGLAEGLDLGRNALGALLTRGLAEAMRLGVRLGARPETFLGLAGIGDLVITSTSELSRNYRVGLGLARGRGLSEILLELQMVAEGVSTCRAVIELARARGVEMPIAAQVHAVLFAGQDPRQAVLELMRRPPKPEFWGFAG
jgi:glycerol-3-phosphate dehydrogenase (NAD(P)+)